MIKYLDFLSVFVATFLACYWVDNLMHRFLLILAIVVTNLVGFFRGASLSHQFGGLYKRNLPQSLIGEYDE